MYRGTEQNPQPNHTKLCQVLGALYKCIIKRFRIFNGKCHLKQLLDAADVAFVDIIETDFAGGHDDVGIGSKAIQWVRFVLQTCALSKSCN